MRHRGRGRKLNRNSSHRRSLMRNMARALFLSKDGQIVTTVGKAKEARPFVEKLVTLARRGDEVSRRQAVALLGEARPSFGRIPPKPRDARDRKRWKREGLPRILREAPPVVAERLFREIGPRFKDRPGGYTRILRLQARRLGDNAGQVLLAFVGDSAAKSSAS